MMNKLQAALITNIFIVQNLQSNSSSENTFVVPVMASAVNKAYQSLKLIQYIKDIFENFLIQVYLNSNLIYFNVFVSPVGLHVLSNPAQYSFHGTLGTENKLLENFMEKAFILYSRPYKKVSDSSIFIYENLPLIDFDRFNIFYYKIPTI